MVEEGNLMKNFIISSVSHANMEPLRKSHKTLKILINYFLRKECRKQGLLLKEFSKDVKELFMEYDWPGNVQELQKAIEKAVLYNPKAHIITKLIMEQHPLLIQQNKRFQVWIIFHMRVILIFH